MNMTFSFTGVTRFFSPMKANRLNHSRLMSLIRNESYMDGEWVPTGKYGTFDVYNPSTGECLGSVPDMGANDALKAIRAAKQSFESWKRMTCKERSDILKRWYLLMSDKKDDLAMLITLESGKALCDAVSETSYGNSFIEWFAEEGRRTYGDVVPSSFPTQRPLCIRQPVGVAAVITPWNFPLAMFTRKAGAALAAGCTVVSKPAEDTPYTVIAAARLAEEAGLPQGVLNVVTCSKLHAAEIGQTLCESPDVRVISFTGSSAVGKMLLRQSADCVKRVCLELGGNAPFIVFESANLKKAATSFITTKFRCSGQTCVSANKIFIQRSVHDKFLKELLSEMAKLRVGDGLEAGVTQGPLINQAAVDKVHSIVNDALAKGATAVMGGQLHKKGGNFYELTVLDKATADMRCIQEEIFGPVAGIVQFDTEEEALKLANQTQVGLGAYFFSENYSQIWRVSEQIEAGMVGVNTGVISAVESTFGGWKQSGLGSESGKYGIDEYLERKYIAMGGIDV